jgi:transcriptional regulator with GAF, ATPase, and Fis domain
VAAQAQAEMLELRAPNALPATLFVAPREAAKLPGGFDLEPLLRVVELGLDVSAFREKKRDGRDGQEQSTLASQSFMPGFIHSSPAMTQLVEEVHKIRSSDVTVLVTGESGTGKELVARAIHALSARAPKSLSPLTARQCPKN